MGNWGIFPKKKNTKESIRLKLTTCKPFLTRFHRDLREKAENKRAKDVFL